MTQRRFLNKTTVQDGRQCLFSCDIHEYSNNFSGSRFDPNPYRVVLLNDNGTILHKSKKKNKATILIKVIVELI